MKKYYLVLQLLGWFIPVSYAQEVWTLEKCINYAKENNISIKQGKLNEQLSKMNLQQSKASLLPSLSGDGNYGISFGRAIDPTTNANINNKEAKTFSGSLSSSLPIYAGYQKQNAIKENLYNWQANQAELEKLQNDISIQVASAYLNVLYSREQLKVANNQLQLTAAQKERTEKLIQAGILPELNIKDIIAQQSNEELNRVTAQNNLELGKLKLLQLMQMDATRVIEIDTAIITQTPTRNALLTYYPEYLFTTAQNTQPVIKLNELKLKAAKMGLEISKGGLMPSLSMFGSLGTNFYSAVATYRYDEKGQIIAEKIPFNSQINANFGKRIGVNLSIPIYSGLQSRTAVNRSMIQVKSAQYSLEQSIFQLRQEVYEAYANASAAAQKFEATQKSAEAMSDAFSANEKKFNAGVINTFDYTTAKNNLAKSQIELINAKYDFLFKLKILDFYKGRPLN